MFVLIGERGEYESLMPVPPLDELLSIDQEVCALLGRTPEQIADMGVHEFARLSFEHGIEWTIHPDGGRVKGLTITIEREQSSATHP